MAKSKKVLVSKIEIKLGDDKKLVLSPEQAKELRDILSEMYPGPPRVQKEYIPSPYPVPWYDRPWRRWDLVWTSQGADNKITSKGYEFSTVSMSVK